MIWQRCERILCVRSDNMGDLLMSAPAIAALKESFQCPITLLTSSMASPIAPYIPGIDEVITWDVPWVKGTTPATRGEFEKVVDALKERKFDAAVIFTVFSQNPLPAALLLTIAGIPRRLAYCRENPYHLLSHWIPDPEPYRYIRHQVRRDLELVAAIGAHSTEQKLAIHLPQNYEKDVKTKLTDAGVDSTKPWLIMHPGVSEKKREYPAELWMETGKKIATGLEHQIIITGSKAEKSLADSIAEGIGPGACSLAGSLRLEEFITLIRFSPLLITVNTVSAHLAAALDTKVIVLYALTNPQHTPWKAIGKVLPFSVSEDLESRNEVLRFVQQTYFSVKVPKVNPDEILKTTHQLLIEKDEPLIDELIGAVSADVRLRNQQHPV